MSHDAYREVRRLHRQIAGIGAATVGVLLGLVGFVWLPVRDERVATRDETQLVQDELHAVHARYADPSVAQQLADAGALQRQLTLEWETLRGRVDTFRERSVIREALPTYDDGRIDFKVALYEARAHVSKVAEQRGVALPADLGILETIGTDERAELRLWELIGAVRLLETAIDTGVTRITSLHSLYPLPLALARDESDTAMEFPIEIELEAAYDALLAFMIRLTQPGSFYALRHARIERLSPDRAAPLRARLTVGAILFKVRGVTMTDVWSAPSEDTGGRPEQRRRFSRRRERVNDE